MTPRLTTAMDAVGTGTSAAADAVAAATEAVTDALGGTVPGATDIVFLFASIDYAPQALLDAAVAVAAPARVVACSSFNGFVAGTEGLYPLVAVHLPAGSLSIGVAVAHEEQLDLYLASRDAAALAKERAGTAHPHSVLMILSGGHVGGQRQVVQGAYEVAGATVPLVGGSAASDEGMAPTWLGVDGEIVEQGVVAVWLNAPEPLGVAVAHGWEPVSRPLMVTRARDNVVLELDGRRAVDAYLEVRGPLPDNDHPFGWQVLDRPFGIPTVDGTYEVGMIKGRTDEGGLELFSTARDQSIMRVMGTTTDALLDGARAATRAAHDQLGRPARGAFVFSCAARAALLADRAAEEGVAITEQLGGAAAGGWFTSGEYAMTSGAAGFHNATVVVLAL